MSKPFETVFVTMRPPRFGDHVGVVEEGHFKTVDDVVTLVDINGVQRFDKKGKPICHQLKPGEDARKVAYNLTRDNIPNRSGDFNRKIIYPNVENFDGQQFHSKHVSSQYSNEPELFNFSRSGRLDCRIWYPDLLDFTDGHQVR